jgi:hypothetical protein
MSMEYELSTKLGKALASQGMGNNFSPRLEKTINNLRKKIARERQKLIDCM